MSRRAENSARLPLDWKSVREVVLGRDPLCTRCRLLGVIRQADEVDHIVPRAAGGSSELDNLQGLCTPCHRWKSAHERRGGLGWTAPTACADCGAWNPPGRRCACLAAVS